MRRFDGKYRWFLCRYEPLRDEAGNVVNWYGTAIDIDDLKRAQEALSANEQNLRLTVDSIPALMAAMRMTGEVELVNRHTLEYLGKQSDEWTIGDAVHPEDRPGSIDALRRAVETGEPLEHEHRVRRADGVYRWHQLRGLPQRSSVGHIVRWYLLATDIEDLKRAEQKLRESEQEFQRITDLIAQAIVVLSADGTLLYVNRVTLQKTGLTLDEIKARGYFCSAFHPDDVKNLWPNRMEGLSRGEPFELEMRETRPGADTNGFSFNTSRTKMIRAESSVGM